MNDRLRVRAFRLWSIWALPARAVGAVLLLDAFAVGLTLVSIPLTSVENRQWLWFGVLTTAAVLHLEAVRTIERRREKAVAGAPYTNLKSLWVCSAVLLLPLPLVVALIAVSFTYCWLRVYGHAVVHRKIFSAATFVIASASAAAVLHAGGLTEVPRIPADAWSLLVITGAVGTWWLVNYALVVGAILLSVPDSTLKRALGDPADQLVVFAALGLGVAAAVLVADHPWALPVLGFAVLCVHRDLLLPQFQRAARTDSKTGLAAPTYWADVVRSELARARTAGSPVGVLMLDLDHFSEINNSHGHPAGDEALNSLARTVRQEVRRDDLVARFGGDELAIVLPEAGPDVLLVVAERIRESLSMPLTLTRTMGGKPVTIAVTVTIGAAVYPHSGGSYEQLLLAADTALYEAKQAGRNQVRLHLPPRPDSPSEVPEVA